MERRLAELHWGIDLGGTKIEAVVVDRDLQEVARMRMPTEAAGGYEHILSRIVLLVDTLARQQGLVRPALVGIGTPGRYDRRSSCMKNSNTLCLNGRDLLRDLQSALQAELRLENDANCFALAEARLGSALPFMVSPDSMVFGIILGTGVGGGIATFSGARHGAHGIAGEWGHNELLHGGDACYCGRRGCVETVLSGPALERHYAVLTGRHRPLAWIASSREPEAVATIDRLVEQFGKALGAVLNLLDPDACVIGGGVGRIARLYGPETVCAIERHLFSGKLEIPILRPRLGDSAGVYGAALLTLSS